MTCVTSNVLRATRWTSQLQNIQLRADFFSLINGCSSYSALSTSETACVLLIAQGYISTVFLFSPTWYLLVYPKE